MNSVAKPMIRRGLSGTSAPALGDDVEVEDVQMEGLDWSGQTASGVSLNGTAVVKGDFTGAILSKAVFHDARFEKCQLAGVVMDEGGCSRVEIADAQATGLILTNARLSDVYFRGCRLNLANFRFTQFKHVIFEDCMLAEADFAYVTAEHVSFRGCDLSGAQFSGAKFHDVDLRTSDISGLSGIAGLRGATIDESQLIASSHALAQELGITVAD